MIRKIIQIDEEKCVGCGACAKACHEGAIEMKDGKAKLVRDDYCDGLGDCLPSCPVNAISFVEREAAAYDEKAVLENKDKKRVDKHTFGCPGMKMKSIKRKEKAVYAEREAASELRQWPVQIKLVPVNAPYFENCNLLIAADCTAYAYGGFHSKFMRNKVTLIGCPKLDDTDYSLKLTEIIKNNSIKSVTVVRMEVPCCSGLSHAAEEALKNSGKFIPWQIVTVSSSGDILE